LRQFNQRTFTVPCLLQFIRTSKNLGLTTIWFHFLSDGLVLRREFPRKSAITPFFIKVLCRHLDRQVSSAVQIVSGLQPVLSSVEQLTLSHEVHNQSSERHDEVDRTQWRELIRPFSNVQTLHVQGELVGKISRSIQSDDGEPPLELLPNLKELGYSEGSNARDAFTPFMNERQAAGHPVSLTMVDHKPW
jgi:hypothetical protein